MTDTTQVAAAVATEAKTVVADVTADVAKVTAEVPFVKANWGKVSAIVVGSAVVGFILGHLL